MSNGNGRLYIEGERVNLRWWDSRDEITQRSWPPYDDPMSTLWNIPRSVSMYNSLLSYHSTMRRVWAIEDQHKQLVGRISLRDIDHRAQRARLGISLGAPYVGQGLGTEAMILFLDHFFEHLGFQIMVLDVAAFNERAVHCYERLGFRHVSDDWRRTSIDTPLRRLDEADYAHLQRYFRRERLGAWVLFYDMELRRAEWQEHRLTLTSSAARLSE